MIRKFAIALALTFSSMTAALAVPVVTQAPTPNVAFANPVTTLFTLAPHPNAVFVQNIPGPSVNAVYRSPWDGTSNPGGVFSSIFGTATYVFTSSRTALSLVWGSPDLYNDIVFLLGNTVVGTVNGGQVQPCCAINIGNSLVTITGVTFDAIRIESTRAAMEYANLAAIPLPAGGLLLIGALGGLAALRRRKIAA